MQQYKIRNLFVLYQFIWLAAMSATLNLVLAAPTQPPPVPAQQPKMVPKKPMLLSPKAAAQVSPQMTRPLPLTQANRPITLAWTVSLAGNPAQSVWLLTSTDLTNWVIQASFADTNGDYVWTDPNPQSPTFYQVIGVGSVMTVTNLIVRTNQ